MKPQTAAVLTLGTGQTLAWASAFYMPAILAAPMSASFRLSPADVFAMFSAALFLSGLVGPLAGRAIDRWGGRPVLVGSNLLFASGFGVLATASGSAGLLVGWLLLGLGMGCGLYEAAFATLVRLHGSASRGGITGITLLGGFASTVGWSLSALMLAWGDWRAACAGWAALHLLLGLPLHGCLPNVQRQPSQASAGAQEPTDAATPAAARAGPSAYPMPLPRLPQAPPARSTLALLSLAFSLHWFVTTAMAAHLPGVLQASGVTLAAAVAVGALVGPAQVAGRLLDFGALQRLPPLRVARMAMLAHPLGAALLLGFGAVAAAPFALLHGAGNGILTIAKGTLPLQLFGAAGYGARQGWLVLPGRLLQGFAPWLFGLALTEMGARVLWLSALLCTVSFLALWRVRPRCSAAPDGGPGSGGTR